MLQPSSSRPMAAATCTGGSEPRWTSSAPKSSAARAASARVLHANVHSRSCRRSLACTPVLLWRCLRKHGATRCRSTRVHRSRDNTSAGAGGQSRRLSIRWLDEPCVAHLQRHACLVERAMLVPLPSWRDKAREEGKFRLRGQRADGGWCPAQGHMRGRERERERECVWESCGAGSRT